MKKQILIIGNPSFLDRKNYDCLNRKDFRVDFINRFVLLEHRLAGRDYDLIIIDSDLADGKIDQYGDAFLKTAGNIPVIVVSNNQNDEVMVESLNFGADLFLNKPINQKTFSAVITAFLRKHSRTDESNMIKAGPFAFNQSTLAFYKNDMEIKLSKKESSMMKILMDNPGRVYSFDELYRLVWGEKTRPDKNTIMVYINRLRNKIDDEQSSTYIQNTRGKGYKLDV